MQSQERLTVGHLKRHCGPIMVWVKLWDEDGEYLPMAKAALLRTIGADVPFSRDGLHDDTALSADSRLLIGADGRTLYID